MSGFAEALIALLVAGIAFGINKIKRISVDFDGRKEDDEKFN